MWQANDKLTQMKQEVKILKAQLKALSKGDVHYRIKNKQFEAQIKRKKDAMKELKRHKPPKLKKQPKRPLHSEL